MQLAGRFITQECDLCLLHLAQVTVYINSMWIISASRRKVRRPNLGYTGEIELLSRWNVDCGIGVNAIVFGGKKIHVCRVRIYVSLGFQRN